MEAKYHYILSISVGTGSFVSLVEPFEGGESSSGSRAERFSSPSLSPQGVMLFDPLAPPVSGPITTLRVSYFVLLSSYGVDQHRRPPLPSPSQNISNPDAPLQSIPSVSTRILTLSTRPALSRNLTVQLQHQQRFLTKNKGLMLNHSSSARATTLLRLLS